MWLAAISLAVMYTQETLIPPAISQTYLVRFRAPVSNSHFETEKKFHSTAAREISYYMLVPIDGRSPEILLERG